MKNIKLLALLLCTIQGIFGMEIAKVADKLEKNQPIGPVKKINRKEFPRSRARAPIKPESAEQQVKGFENQLAQLQKEQIEAVYRSAEQQVKGFENQLAQLQKEQIEAVYRLADLKTTHCGGPAQQVNVSELQKQNQDYYEEALTLFRQLNDQYLKILGSLNRQVDQAQKGCESASIAL